MNSYLIARVDGPPVEIEADVFERDGEAWVFTAGTQEVLRLPASEVASITKAR